MSSNIDLINFIDLTFEKKKMVLSWRNHPSVKQWMYNDTDITLDEHLAFIESLKDSIDKLYFLVQQDDNYLGVINFTNINKNTECVEFGLYSNADKKIAGVGRILEKISIDYVFNVLKVKRLKLEVLSENVQVRNLHKKFNFKETAKKIVNNKEVICMELKHENR